MLYVLIPLYVIVCVFLILVVLLQQGKGADVASAFCASSSQTTFGARGAATVFERVTTWSFVAFALLAVAISIVQTRNARRSIMSGAETKKAVTAPAKPGTPAPAVPATAPVPVPVAPAPATK